MIKKLMRNHLALFGITLLLFFGFVAIIAPWIAPPKYPDEPYRMPRYGWSSVPQPPSPQHPFGLAQGQYDIYYGVIWGTRTAFKVALIVVGASLALGVTIGSLSAYYGGWLDEILMRVVDIFLSFPFLVSAVVLTALLGKGLDKVMIAMTAFGWMGYARLTRGNVLAIKEEGYVLAARACGVGDFGIITRHILPNAISPVLVHAFMNLGAAVATASSLSFLGLGAPEGYADWGQLISLARNWLLGIPGNPFFYWYTIVYPGLALFLFVLAWNLIGDALRDVLDPRQGKWVFTPTRNHGILKNG